MLFCSFSGVWRSGSFSEVAPAREARVPKEHVEVERDWPDRPHQAEQECEGARGRGFLRFPCAPSALVFLWPGRVCGRSRYILLIFLQIWARFRQCRNRFLQAKTLLAVLLEIYSMIRLNFQNIAKFGFRRSLGCLQKFQQDR